jgi:hypothetical protein
MIQYKYEYKYSCSNKLLAQGASNKRAKQQRGTCIMPVASDSTHARSDGGTGRMDRGPTATSIALASSTPSAADDGDAHAGTDGGGTIGAAASGSNRAQRMTCRSDTSSSTFGRGRRNDKTNGMRR